MSGPPESRERVLLRELLKRSRARITSVAGDGSAVLSLGAVVVLSSSEMQLITDLLS